MISTKRTIALAVLFVASLMALGTACGGSSSTSTSGNSISESPQTTSKSGESGGDSNGCAELFNQMEKLFASFDALETTANANSPANMDAVVKALESFSSDVPEAIRGDWKTIVSGIKTYVNDLNGLDFNTLNDPATLEKMANAGSVFEGSEYRAATDNLNAWTQKNCPGYDF